MRVTKLHWVGAMALGGLLGLGSLAQAQENKDKPAAPATPAAPAAPATPAIPAVRPDLKTARVEARLRGLAQRLNLTDEQKGKIKPILEEEVQKYEAMQQDKTIPAQERMKKFREVREASDAKIKPLLSAEQQQKLETVRTRPPRRAETPAAPAAPKDAAPAK